MCCFVLLNQYWGIVTVPGFHHERAKGDTPTIRDRRHPSSSCFLFCFVATQLAKYTEQELLQVVYSNKEAWKRLARRHSRNLPWTQRQTQIRSVPPLENRYGKIPIVYKNSSIFRILRISLEDLFTPVAGLNLLPAVKSLDPSEFSSEFSDLGTSTSNVTVNPVISLNGHNSFEFSHFIGFFFRSFRIFNSP